MREVSNDKFLISASVKKETVELIQAIANASNRGFSPMVDILLAEAVEARKKAENDFKRIVET